MESKIQKPIQSNRKGEVAEGLPGSLKSVACVKRNTRELGRPNSFLVLQRGKRADKPGELMKSWESCSYGYRPSVGARTAVDELRVKLQFGGYHHLMEADIKGFFDNLSHEWLMCILAKRVDDEPFLRLIKKWLKAGVLDTDGKVLRPESGTPVRLSFQH